MQGEASEWDKSVFLPTMRLLGAALQKEGPESGAVGAKGLRAPRGITRTHPGSQAEAAEQVFGQEDLLVLPGHGWSWNRGCICQLRVYDIDQGP